jgi:hypothetical protein
MKGSNNVKTNPNFKKYTTPSYRKISATVATTNVSLQIDNNDRLVELKNKI